MTESPLLSVVIPWRDTPSPIELAAKIVTPAVNAGLQVIVVDDYSELLPGSDVKSILESKGAHYLRLPIWSGPGEARNVGLDRVDGRFVTFIDADDAPKFEVLKKLSILGERTHADVVIGSYRHIDHNGAARIIAPGKSLANAINIQPAIWRYAFRKEFLHRNGIRFPSGTYAEDLTFLLRILSKDPRVITAPDTCYDYLDKKDTNRLSRKKLTETDFIAATHRISLITPTDVSPEFEHTRNAWLVRIWIRRLRNASGIHPVISTALHFPRRKRILRDSALVITRIMLGKMCREVDVLT